jgi:hypothetical protein
MVGIVVDDGWCCKHAQDMDRQGKEINRFLFITARPSFSALALAVFFQTTEPNTPPIHPTLPAETE